MTQPTYALSSPTSPGSQPRGGGLLLVAAIVALIALPACKFLDPTSEATSGIDAGFDGGGDLTLPEGAFFGADGTIQFGNRIGEECSSNGSCRSGLTCESGQCQPSPTGAADEACTVSGECGSGLSCGFPRACWDDAAERAAAGTPVNPLAECGLAACVPNAGGEEDSECSTPEDCGDGLRCNLIGFTGACQPEGQGDVGQPCEDHVDCRDPLLCAPPSELTGVDGFSCQIPAAVAEQLFMPSVECEVIPDDRDFAVFFEVPGGDGPDEFYRLPFPNDIRLRDGRVDMSGHHNPGLIYIGGGLVDAYLNAAERLDGFSTNPAVFFRFTQNPDFSSIVGGGDNPTIHFVNIDPDSTGYGNRIGMRWSVTTGGGKFICPRYIAVRPTWTSPLEHDTTYAVFFTSGIRSNGGEIPVTEPDFAAMLAPDAPAEGRLASAWDAYAPFRDYLVAEGLSADSIVAAAVFTTQDPDVDMAALRDGARALDPPQLENLTRCGANVTGPCDDGERGACVNAAGDMIELHATYRAPVFQRGTAPFLSEADGGDIDFGNGSAVAASEEAICVSLTIPTGEMPENGWPVVMFGHGTGGAFTSHIAGGTAARLASIDVGDGVRMASVGIDGPQHGPRRGGSTLSPELLFYNFANPLAAVGNVQAGAADFFTLTWLLENFDDEIDGVGQVRFDVQNMYYFGHSQGSTSGGLFAAYEENLRAAIFSGAGGGLILSLLNKTNPQDVAAGVEFVLTDGGRTGGSVSDTDPLLSILQMVIDPVDPLNYARLYAREPVDPEGFGLHVFMSFGLGDTYTPDPTQEAFARAAALAIPAGAERGLEGFRGTEYPVSGNRSVNGEPVTAVVIPGEPSGDYDGHFVIFREPDLADQSMEFLGTMVTDGVPTVSAP